MSHCLHPCTFNKDTITTALCLCVLGLGIGGPREGWVASPHPSEWRDLLVGLAVEVGRGHWLWGPWLLSRALLTLPSQLGTCRVKHNPEAGSRTSGTELSLPPAHACKPWVGGKGM